MRRNSKSLTIRDAQIRNIQNISTFSLFLYLFRYSESVSISSLNVIGWFKKEKLKICWWLDSILILSFLKHLLLNLFPFYEPHRVRSFRTVYMYIRIVTYPSSMYSIQYIYTKGQIGIDSRGKQEKIVYKSFIILR